ncbi:MAG TPA: phosphoribosyltransferase [Acidobacteriaceae bacterium]|nr:phosphoribosyltransferase [Acidobacteriaceae bacterium]
MVFADRRDAGRALAKALREQATFENAIVLALPRGGVPVAYEVATELHLPLDVFIVRKLGVPFEPELAMGAVASGGIVVLNEQVLRLYSIRREEVDAAITREQEEIARREVAYREGRPAAQLSGCAVIVIDDGLATGATMRAAIRALRPMPARMIVGVPVAAAGTCEQIRDEVDQLIALECPESFSAVGEFYREFEPTTDDEVRALLAASHSRPAV